MKQLLINYRTGKLKVEDVPAPALQQRGVLVRNHYSLVSAGTERAAFTFARQSLVGKARSRPDLVRQVVNKARTDGLLATYRAATERLNTSTALGYSSSGEVIEVGLDVAEVSPGDLVACAGGGYASHAEVVFVPRNLVARLPEGVSTRQGAFGTLGAIALQGIHRAELTPGERVAVIGLGLLGQLTVQILNAYGMPVLGLDVDADRVKAAARWGLDANAVIGRDDAEVIASAFSNGAGVDAVIITAATDNNEPIEMAGRLLRERGRVSVVGDVGMDVPRRLYYDRELDIRVSRSYGPGRYDPSYEERGIDYPIAYARWTEQRNMQEFLRLVASGRLDVDGLTTHTFSIDRAKEAYHLISENPQRESFLGLLVEYPKVSKPVQRRLALRLQAAGGEKTDAVQVGLIGGGNFARGTILPALRAIKQARIKAVATAGGASAKEIASRYGCDYATTDYHELLQDESIDLIIVATRHNLHAPIAVEALQAGKNVHVEKPLALNHEGLQAVARAAASSRGRLMVGFNRRFAPLVLRANEHFGSRSTPLAMHYRVNADSVPADHWVHDPDEGGGRILGEVCHFVDLLHFLAGAPPRSVFATRMPGTGQNVLADDNLLATVDFADGSRGGILYSAQGAEAMPKELIEVMGNGKSAALDNFRSLQLYRGISKSTHRSRQDKGHRSQFEALVNAIIHGGDPPIPLEDLLLSSEATLCIVQSLNEASPVRVDTAGLFPQATDEPAPGTTDS